MHFAWPRVILRAMLVLSVCVLIGIVSAAMVGRMLPAPGELAFMARENENWDIYVIDLQRRIIEQVTAGQGNNRFPAWSPDGSQIVFHSDRDNLGDRRQYELYVMSPDGRSQRPLTGDNLAPFAAFLGGEPDFSQGSAMAAWSPDGESIAFHSDIGGNWDLYLLDVSSGEVRALTHSPNDEVLAAWSPDGTHIAYAAGPDDRILIYVMEINGENVRQVTGQNLPDRPSPETTLEPMPPLMATATALVPPSAIVPRSAVDTDLIQHWHPEWSSDGRRLIFASQEGTFIEDLYIVNVETGDVTRLTDNAYAEFNPIWLPDDRFVFTSDREVIRNLWMMNSDGSGLTRLTPRTYEADGAAWRPQR